MSRKSVVTELQTLEIHIALKYQSHMTTLSMEFTVFVVLTLFVDFLELVPDVGLDHETNSIFSRLSLTEIRFMAWRKILLGVSDLAMGVFSV